MSIIIKNKDFKSIILKRRIKIAVVGFVAVLFSLLASLIFNFYIINPFLNEQQKNITDSFRAKLYSIAIFEETNEKTRKELKKIIDWPSLWGESISEEDNANKKIDIFMSFCCLFISFITGIICLISIGYLKSNDIDTTFAAMGPLEQEQLLAKIHQSLKTVKEK